MRNENIKIKSFLLLILFSLIAGRLISQNTNALSVKDYVEQTDSLLTQRNFAEVSALSNRIEVNNLTEEDEIAYYLQLQKLYDPLNAVNFDSVFHYIEKVLSLTDSDSLTAAQVFSRGNMKVYTGDFPGANEDFLFVEERAEQLPTELDSVKLYSRLSLTSYAIEDKIKWLEELSIMAEKSTNPKAKIYAYFDQVNYFLGKADSDKLKDLLPRFKAAHFMLKDSFMISTACKLISAVYNEKEIVNFDSSEFYVKRAMRHLSMRTPPYEKYKLQLSLATTYYNQKRYAEAVKNGEEVIRGLEQFGMEGSEEMRQAYSIVGTSIELQGRPKEALPYFYKELDLSRAQGAMLLTERALKAIIRVKRELKEYDDLIPYFDDLFILRDSLKIQYGRDKVTEAETRLGLTLKEQELANTNLRIEQQEKQQKLYLGLIALLSLLLAGGLWAYRRIRRDRELINQQKLQVESALTEKEFLLKEIHHRVKNNLQIISSLLEKQARTSGDPNLKDKMQEGKDRIQSMALIHQNLYQSESLSNIDIRKYIHELAHNIAATQQAPDQNIKIDIQSDELSLNIDQAIPVGLILNELITNTFKHAFKDRPEGLVKIIFHQPEPGRFTLNFSDNGKGMKPDFNIRKSKSLGMNLVQGLVRQLEGKFEYESSPKGTIFRIKFPV